MMFCLPPAGLADDDDIVVKRPLTAEEKRKANMHSPARTERQYTRTLQIDRVATNSLSI